MFKTSFKILILFLLSSPVLAQAPPNSLVVDSSGNIGIGTDAPEGPFHVDKDGVVISYFESATGAAVQMRFRSDSGNRRFLAVRNDNTQESQLIFGNNSILLAGPTTSGADLWATIDASGITTSGAGACNPGPCDAVFRPEEFKVRPIDEHATFMWENQYLWGVGSTKEGEPVNLTKKTTGILHELEVAHIYIEQLHKRLEKAEKSNQNLEDRLIDIEAKLEANL